MSRITTHVLDTARGIPAQGMPVSLYRRKGDEWSLITEGVTNADGRIPDFLPEGDPIPLTTYRMHFDTGAYFERSGEMRFYPYVDVVFELVAEGHYHVPLLLSPFGYSTYRGS
jgi:5-hydroxyisourate hydrolase